MAGRGADLAYGGGPLQGQPVEMHLRPASRSPRQPARPTGRTKRPPPAGGCERGGCGRRRGVPLCGVCAACSPPTPSRPGRGGGSVLGDGSVLAGGSVLGGVLCAMPVCSESVEQIQHSLTSMRAPAQCTLTFFPYSDGLHRPLFDSSDI